MECKTTITSARGRAGFTLVELMTAAALGALGAAVIALLYVVCTRSFLGLNNYTALCQQSQLALDKMSKDIRQAHSLTAYATNSLTFLDVNGNALQYAFNPANGTLVRTSGGTNTTYLTNCNSLQFFIFQHTAISNTFDCYLPAVVTNARVIQVTWSCAKKIMGTTANTENIESAQYTLRNF